MERLSSKEKHSYAVFVDFFLFILQKKLYFCPQAKQLNIK